MKVISACLIGCECRYDHQSCLQPELEQLLRDGKVIPVCPEQLGGLPR